MSETTTKATHTKGPWSLDEPDKWPYPLRIYAGGEVIVRIDRAAHSTAQKSLADCLDAVGFNKGNQRAEVIEAIARQRADARLIASAPDLLKELEHLVRLIEPLERDGGLSIPGLATLNGARAAIAKARAV